MLLRLPLLLLITLAAGQVVSEPCDEIVAAPEHSSGAPISQCEYATERHKPRNSDINKLARDIDTQEPKAVPGPLRLARDDAATETLSAVPSILADTANFRGGGGRGGGSGTRTNGGVVVVGGGTNSGNGKTSGAAENLPPLVYVTFSLLLAAIPAALTV